MNKVSLLDVDTAFERTSCIADFADNIRRDSDGSSHYADASAVLQ